MGDEGKGSGGEGEGSGGKGGGKRGLGTPLSTPTLYTTVSSFCELVLVALVAGDLVVLFKLVLLV